MGEAALMLISDMEISTISDADLNAAFMAVVAEHKDAVESIHQSMVDATEAYKKYLDDGYEPFEDVAKKDRATLNRAEKSIVEKYAELKTAYERPLENFELNIRSIRNEIKKASGIVDVAVKNYEEKQKSEKREQIQKYFDGKKFELVPLDRIFDAKWLNKGTKMSDIREQLDEKIAAVYRDIEVLERLPEHGQIAKAVYLEKLDMGAALRQVDILRENAERLAREEANREARKGQEQVAANAAAERREEKAVAQEERVQSLVDEALDLPADTAPVADEPKVIECTLRFKGTKQQLLKLKEYMTSQGIPYENAVVFENDLTASQYLREKRIIGRQIRSVVFLPASA